MSRDISFLGKSYLLLFFFTMTFRSYYYFGFVTVFPMLGAILSGYIYLYKVKVSILDVFYLIVILILSIINSLLTDDGFIGIVKLLSCTLIYITAKNISTLEFHKNRTVWLEYIYRLLLLFLLYIISETFIRYLFGTSLTTNVKVYLSDNMNDVLSGGFYKYKIGSPYFQDSNFTFLFILPLIFLMFNMKDFILNNKKAYKFFLFVLFSLVLLTLSRSGYFALFFFVIMTYFNSKIEIKYYIPLSFLIIIVTLFPAYFIYDLVKDDHSFNTKIEVWINTLNYFYDQNITNILFGHGFDIGKYVFSYNKGSSSHSLIPQLLGEIGIIGLIIYLYILFVILKNIRHGLILFFVIILVGFSLFDPWDPFIYGVIGLVKGIDDTVTE